MEPAKQDIIQDLRREILRLQGLKAATTEIPEDFGLGAISHVFPQGVFPTGVVHELTTAESPMSAASGFACYLLSRLMRRGTVSAWISTHRTLFPPALAGYGIEPDRILFIDAASGRDALWAMEEALRCDQLAAVVGEVRDLDFTASRRLQLAVEKSKVTGLVLRPSGSRLVQNACVSRWHISSLPSTPSAGLPGVGHARWKVELLKMRGGKTGMWEMEWTPETLHILSPAKTPVTADKWRKIG